jgi:hypothetical protein
MREVVGSSPIDLYKTKKGYIMINKIYIPTVCRVDNQITYNNLPKELQKKVVFVVQEWERNQYKIDAEYFVLPSDITKLFMKWVKNKDMQC